MWTSSLPSLIKSPFNNTLTVLNHQSFDVDIINQRKVQITPTAHARPSIQLRDGINAEFHQIADAEPNFAISSCSGRRGGFQSTGLRSVGKNRSSRYFGTGSLHLRCSWTLAEDN